ncbi:LAFA_0D09274g1_1 [Lachancea sp. 'fantastica']|nr:LAFA_0D09274g1_1 [Lachancea sp. 'fantastica']
MGKSKRRSRASRFKTAPLGKKDKSALNDEAVTVKRIQPLLKQLQSAVPNDRSMALGNVVVLCEDPFMRKLFLKEKLVHLVLAKLLSDDNMDIVVEAHGLLRNLAIEEGYDVCVFLWRSDIWKSISSGFAKIEKSLQWLSSNTPAKKESTRQLFDFGDNLLSLIVALVNGCAFILDDILGSDKSQEIFAIVRSITDYGLEGKDGNYTLRIPISLFNSILDLLYDLSSESLEFIEAVSADSYLSEFIKALPSLQMSAANELTGVLTQGILLQFLDSDITSEQANAIKVKVCSTIENINLEQMKKALSNTDIDNELKSSSNDQISGKIKEFNKQRALAAMHLQSIEATLDIVTASLELIAAKAETESETTNTELIRTLTVSLPVVFRSLFDDFKVRVLIAWNNMLWLYLTLQINFLELPNDAWQQLWDSLSTENETESRDFSLRLGRLGVTWALLKTVQLQESQTAYLGYLKCDNIDFVSSIIAQYMEIEGLDKEEIQDLRQRCCGVLGCIAMLPGHIELNRQIGQFLIEQLASDKTDSATLVDICDVVIDIYCDANFDYDEPVFVQGGFVKVLQNSVVTNLKQNFKFVDKNKEPDLKDRCQQTLSTLERFIDYKSSERR